jgi:hypothetical protein
MPLVLTVAIWALFELYVVLEDFVTSSVVPSLKLPNTRIGSLDPTAVKLKIGDSGEMETGNIWVRHRLALDPTPHLRWM